MQPAEMLAQLAADGRALAAAATDLDAQVPPCPGWTVKDAVEHTAMVYAHKSEVLETGAFKEGDWPPPGLTYEDVIEFYDEQLHRLIENLRTRDPAAHAGTWYEPDQTVGFWVRRMMQETVIHRADVESAVGPPSRVADEIAVDGIDELIECFLGFDTWAYPHEVANGQRIAVRTGESGWTVTLTPGKPTFQRVAADDADATMSGAASDLLLALWNRLPYDAARTEGDPEALAALRTALAACTR